MKLNIFQEEALSWWAQALGTDFAEKPHVRKNVLEEFKNLFDDVNVLAYRSNVNFFIEIDLIA